MSISPSSDILLGVAKAADPQRYKAAVEKLARAAGDRMAAADLAAAAATKTAPTALSQNAAAILANAEAAASARAGSAPLVPSGKQRPDKAYTQFEAFFLQTFVESMLPQESSGFFGTGPAGMIWKSMLAEQIANELAKSGEFGIAKKIADHRAKMRKSVTPAAVRPATPGSKAQEASADYLAPLQKLLGTDGDQTANGPAAAISALPKRG